MWEKDRQLDNKTKKTDRNNWRDEIEINEASCKTERLRLQAIFAFDVNTECTIDN